MADKDEEQKERSKYRIEDHDVSEVQERLSKAEYTLELLADREHYRIDKLFSAITANYRTANNRDALETFHTQTRLNNPREEAAYDELIKNSKAAGTIRTSLVKGNLDIEMITVGLSEAEILARTSKEQAAIILQGIGLTASADMTPLLLQALGIEKKK